MSLVTPPRKTLTILVGLLLAVCSGCGGGLDVQPPGSGQVEIKVTDAPAANGLSLLLTVGKFQIKGAGDWQTVVTKSFTIDLTPLVGYEQSLGKGYVPAGSYTQLRFSIANPVISHSGDNIDASLKSPQPVFPIIARVSEGKLTTILVDISGADSFAFQGQTPVFDIQAKVTVR